MSILCYVTFNDGGSVLKSVCGEWGPMFSPENPDLARSAASQWCTPRPPVLRCAQLRKPSAPHSPPPPPPLLPPLAPQISSSRLNRPFYFISLSSGEQHRSVLTVCGVIVYGFIAISSLILKVPICKCRGCPAV